MGGIGSKSVEKCGYTLIEVLLATMLFSIIVMLASFSLEQGLKYYHGLAERGLNFWRRAEPLWLNNIFGAMIDYYVRDEDKRKWYPFFTGTREFVAGVSGRALGERFPVIFVIEKEVEAKGKFALVYYELPVSTMNHKELKELIDFKQYKQWRKIKLYSGLVRVEFRYFGRDEKNIERWHEEYDSWRYQSLPSLIRIDLSYDIGDDIIYLPLYVNSLHKGIYDEIY